VHVPPQQASSEGHTVPQPPQLAESVCVSVQPFAHTALSPAGQQLPPLHAAPPPQTFPQEPQLVASVSRSVQRLAQTTCWGAQQTPRLHGTPAPQFVPHVPQLVSSVCVSLQVPPQHVSGELQPHVPPQPSEPPQDTPSQLGVQQLPWSQTWPALQLVLPQQGQLPPHPSEVPGPHVGQEG